MSVQGRSILPPYVGGPSTGDGGSIPSTIDPTTGASVSPPSNADSSTPEPTVSNGPMGDCGVAGSEVSARHSGMLDDHLAARARYGA